MSKREKLKYACLFGGGAIRGLAHIGVIRALHELKIELGTLAGSSVGAIIATFLAVGCTDKELEQIFLDIDFELFKDINIGKSIALSKGKIFLEWMREVIESKFYGKDFVKGKNAHVRFKDLKTDLVIITTDLTNFTCKEFSKYTTPDFEVAEAVRISACMPGLMRPVELDNCMLVDGDLQKSWPMWRLCETLSSLNENILEVRLEGSVCSNLNNPIHYANTVYSCITSIASDFVTEVYENDEKHDCLVVNTGDVVIVDFRMKEADRKALVRDGYEQTIEYFKNLLPVKKQKILDNYLKLKNYVFDIRENILGDNVERAQIKYANMLALLCQTGSMLDVNINQDLQALSDEILNNCAKSMFLKRVYLKNTRKVLKSLDLLEEQLLVKCAEFEKYFQLVKAQK